MRAPPPVQIACDTGRAWPLLQAFVALGAWFAGVLWLAAWLELGGLARGLALVLPSALLLGIAARRGHRVPRTLAWDGQAWSLGGEPGRPEVMIDLGRWMLLRFRPDSRAPASWLDVSTTGPGRHLWRAALYSSVAQPTSTSR